MILYCKNNATGDQGKRHILKEKVISEQFFQNKESNNDPTGSSTINQSPSYKGITKLRFFEQIKLCLWLFLTSKKCLFYVYLYTMALT